MSDTLPPNAGSAGVGPLRPESQREAERSHHGSAQPEPDFARRMELAGLEPNRR